MFHAKLFGQMECMVTAGIDAVPVRWRFRQQTAKIKNSLSGPKCSNWTISRLPIPVFRNLFFGSKTFKLDDLDIALYLVEVDQMVANGVRAMYPALTR